MMDCSDDELARFAEQTIFSSRALIGLRTTVLVVPLVVLLPVDLIVDHYNQPTFIPTVSFLQQSLN